MEFLKPLYFLTLIFYFFQLRFAKNSKAYWVIILISVTIHAIYFFGPIAIIFLLVSGIISTISELISLKTPIKVFGVSYSYNLTSSFFPSKIIIAKVYPLDITAAWILLKYISFFLTCLILSFYPINPVIKALISAFILVSFDFIIDPIAVSVGAWKWGRKGIFFDIPWQNFLGWFLVGFEISFIFRNLKPIRPFDIMMTIPVLIVTAIFPFVLGTKLIKRDKIKGILASLPLITILILAILSLKF